MQYLASFFVGEARKCSHRWLDSGVEGLVLTYNHPPIATSKVAIDKWEACYLN